MFFDLTSTQVLLNRYALESIRRFHRASPEKSHFLTARHVFLASCWRHHPPSILAGMQAESQVLLGGVLVIHGIGGLRGIWWNSKHGAFRTHSICSMVTSTWFLDIISLGGDHFYLRYQLASLNSLTMQDYPQHLQPLFDFLCLSLRHFHKIRDSSINVKHCTVFSIVA